MNVILGMVVVLGVLILFHEWGHFVLARLFRVRVDVFSIGFGPRLFGWKRGATDYRVSVLPLGGYVRMAGQDPSDIDAGKQTPTGAPDELLSKPRWQRAVICLGGPTVNLLLTVPLFFVFFVVFGEPYPAFFDRPVQVIRKPVAIGSAPGPLRIGDTVVSLNGSQNPTWENVWQAVTSGAPGSRLQMEVENASERRNVSIVVDQKGPDQLTRIFGDPPRVPVVERVAARGPAERAGLRADDKIIALNGRPVYGNEEFVEAVKASGGQNISLRVQRKGQMIDTDVSPHLGVNERGEKVWQVGILVSTEVAYRRVGPVEGIRAASETTIFGITQVFGILEKLVTGSVSLKQLQGVVGIARESGEAVSRGPSSVLQLMATLSLNLGVLNLLPIPILDGGQILLLAIEGARRRDMSLAFKERFVQLGLVFLLVLLAFVMYNDVIRLWVGR